MGSFPDWIYRFTARDEQTTPLELVSAGITLADAGNATITGDIYTVPASKLLVVTSVGFLGIPDALITQQGVRMYWAPPNDGAGNAFLIYARSNVLGAAQIQQNNADFNGVILPSGAVVTAGVKFSGTSAGNTCIASLCGTLIPRGNFAV